VVLNKKRNSKASKKGKIPQQKSRPPQTIPLGKPAPTPYLRPMSTIWAFDLGKGSIGEAVWNAGMKRFDHVASLLIPAEFASTKAAAARRRMMRTRQAHKAREAWLEEVWTQAGLTPLHGRKVGKVAGQWQLISAGDEKLEREFPAPGDSTCYTSCLLRIKLLRGEKLEEWQIYKALRSAIQKRGYDPKIPWKTGTRRKTTRREEVDEDKGTEERMAKFEEELRAMSAKEDHWLSCYFDAWKMGLWNPAQPDALQERLSHHAESTRNRILPRKLVEAEIRLLMEAAGKQLPKLQGKADYVLHGPAEKAYASYFLDSRKAHGLREGAATDWQGVLGQKIPRFDNRIIEKCVLMPRYNVCKVEVRCDKDGKPYPESLLPSEVTCLLKLKNMRIQRIGGPLNSLTPEELRAAFEVATAEGYKLGKREWKKLCLQFGGVPVAPVEMVEEPKAGGRSRFCRPALDVLKRLLLSGESPDQFHAAELARLKGNTDLSKGVVPADLKFLLDMGTAWQGIYVPNQKLEALAQRTADSGAAIRELIGSQNDPIVRHRLTTFWERLKDLEEAHGAPTEIAIEFVREDFMGKKALFDYREFIKRRADERKKARADAAELGATERSATMKMELLRQQGGECLYKGDKLIPTKLDEYEIDHIVPRSQGGPDAMVNYALTLKTTNADKGNRTPFEWLSSTDGWNAYENRVKGKQTVLRNKKVRLLLLPEAAELADKYTALAETAWIAKLSQTIAGLHFGWKNGVDDQGKKRVTVISGGLTARIRRKYKLNSLLAGDGVSEEDAEKNRDDDRHHALDAMVLAFIPGWARDESKQRWFRFPDGVGDNPREFFAHVISKVEPTNKCLSSAALEQTAYGVREIEENVFAVGRESLVSLLVKVNNGKETMKSPDKAETQRIVEPAIRREVETFLKGRASLTLLEWKSWCDAYRVGGKGPRVIKVLMTKTKANALGEYVDVSKDGTEQMRRGEMHRGYFVYWSAAPTKKDPDKRQAKVRPVYAFESVARVKRELNIQGAKSAQYFQSGCTVEIENRVEHSKTPLEAGRYLLNSIWEQGNVVVTSSSGKVSAPLGLAHMLNAGFKRSE